MINSVYSVVIEKKVAKDLRKIGPKQREIILSWIEHVLDGCADPYGISGAKKLMGVDNGVRYRIGRYRILARIDDGRIVVFIFRIGHRNDVYRNVN
jgi:mRNA interferase RelE/StbE